MKEALELIIKDHCFSHECCTQKDKTEVVEEIMKVIQKAWQESYCGPEEEDGTWAKGWEERSGQNGQKYPK